MNYVIILTILIVSTRLFAEHELLLYQLKTIEKINAPFIEFSCQQEELFSNCVEGHIEQSNLVDFKYWSQYQMALMGLKKRKPVRDRNGYLAIFDTSELYDRSDDKININYLNEKSQSSEQKKSHADKVVSIFDHSNIKKLNINYLNLDLRNETELEDALKKIIDFNKNNRKKIQTVSISLSFPNKDPYGTTVNHFEMSESTKKLFREIDSNNYTNILWASGNESIKRDNQRWKIGENETYLANLLPISSISVSQRPSNFNNTGEHIEFSAPSEFSLMTSIGSFGGTSGSTPLVANAFLELNNTNKQLNATQVRALLKSTSLDLGKKGKDDFYGHGQPNIPLAKQVLRKSRLSRIKEMNEKQMIEYFNDIKKKYIEKSSKLKLFYKAENCSQVMKLHQRLYKNYFLSNGNKESRNQLCRFYLNSNLFEGILRFCSESEIKVVLSDYKVKELIGKIDKIESPELIHRHSTFLYNLILNHNLKLTTKEYNKVLEGIYLNNYNLINPVGFILNSSNDNKFESIKKLFANTTFRTRTWDYPFTYDLFQMLHSLITMPIEEKSKEEYRGFIKSLIREHKDQSRIIYVVNNMGKKFDRSHYETEDWEFLENLKSEFPWK
jgi:hypothetical protein